MGAAEPDGIEYTATLIDPDYWTASWTFQQRLTEDNRQLVFEYACHEANYSMVNSLSGTRAKEKREAEQRAKKAAQGGQPER